MRVRILRKPISEYGGREVLSVQKWERGNWIQVLNFELDEYDKATDFSMRLSRTKKEPVEMAVFEEGEKLSESHRDE